MMNRSESGKFAPGNPGGPGRPPKGTEQDYADAVRRAVSPGELADVLRAILGKAKRGDIPAAKLLCAYTLGIPANTVLDARVNELEKLADELSQTRQN